MLSSANLQWIKTLLLLQIPCELWCFSTCLASCLLPFNSSLLFFMTKRPHDYLHCSLLLLLMTIDSYHCKVFTSHQDMPKKLSRSLTMFQKVTQPHQCSTFWEHQVNEQHILSQIWSLERYDTSRGGHSSLSLCSLNYCVKPNSSDSIIYLFMLELQNGIPISSTKKKTMTVSYISFNDVAWFIIFLESCFYCSAEIESDYLVRFVCIAAGRDCGWILYAPLYQGN